MQHLSTELFPKISNQSNVLFFSKIIFPPKFIFCICVWIHLCGHVFIYLHSYFFKHIPAICAILTILEWACQSYKGLAFCKAKASNRKLARIPCFFIALKIINSMISFNCLQFGNVLTKIWLGRRKRKKEAAKKKGSERKGLRERTWYRRKQRKNTMAMFSWINHGACRQTGLGVCPGNALSHRIQNKVFTRAAESSCSLW